MYLLDTSAWSKHLHGKVGNRLAELIEHDQLHICSIVELEFLNAAKNTAQWRDGKTELELMKRAHSPGDVFERALELQCDLLGGKLPGRKIGDLIIAVTAMNNDLTVLHYDRDYEHIQTLWAHFRQEWIVPPGTI